MTYQATFSRYQVETESAQFQSPTKQKAEDEYQKYVNQNIPCEFYQDGELQKEHKPYI